MSEKPTSKPRSEFKGLLILSLALLVLLAVLSFVQRDPRANWLGLVGHFTALGLMYTFGLGSYFLIGYLAWIGWSFLVDEQRPKLRSKTVYFASLLFSVCLLLNVVSQTNGALFSFLQNRVFSEVYVGDHPTLHRVTRFNLGGVPLYYLYCDLPTFNLEHLLSNTGVCITFSITGLFSLILFTGTQLSTVLKKVLLFLKASHALFLKVIKDLKTKPEAVQNRELFEIKTSPILQDFKQEECNQEESKQARVKEEIRVTTMLDRKPLPSPRLTSKQIGYQSAGTYNKRYKLPPLNLLTHPKKTDQPSLKRELRKQSGMLEETLKSFGIEARVGEINCGPTITSFEVHPPTGVKVQKIKVLENDIALNLESASVRIIAPIPGKAVVGVEIPSPFPQEVSFKEMLEEYIKKKRARIPILLGQTVTGESIVSDLTKMPHCIIAGATGSGKSVCINSIVMSMLMTARPDEIRLLLIDPKKVELSAYSNLPHMIAPVITEAHGAYAALNWLVKEMQNRYEILKRLGLRNVYAFNSRKPNFKEEAELPLEVPRKMPFFVAIVDEFADLMMVSSTDLETPIARIAQMARAVGIHLILATQRPSREVITGLIKANFPSRIAFKVASRVNSQIILDENGAESLLGNGDLLFMPPDTSNLTRAQGVFIRDEDINRVVSYIESQAPTDYLINSFDQMTPEEGMNEEQKKPASDLYQQAYEIVTNTGTAATTFLQRKMNLSYYKAAALMDEMESRGVIGPKEGNRPRQILANLKKREEKDS